MKFNSEYRIGDFVSFHNGIVSLTGTIQEVRFNKRGTFYFIEADDEAYYLLEEGRL